MNCPSCAYQSPYSAMRCPQCRTVFDSEAVETLGHLVYLRERLTEWRTSGLLDADDAAEALRVAEQEIRALGEKLALMPVAAAAPAAGPVATSAESAVLPGVAPGEIVAEHLPAPHVHEEPAAPAYNGAAASHGTMVDEPQDREADADAEAAAPTGPAFEWRNVGTYLLSERTLHGLLGLGAFLILASGVVISTLNPTGLGPIAHLAAVVATTLLVFGAGYVVRQRLHLTIAGATLLGIAGAFVPLTIWTLGQRQILNWETGAIWLVASLVSLPLYLVAQRILRDRTFALLAALAGGSQLLAVLNWIGVPLEWGLAALVLLAIGYARLAWHLGDTTAGLSWAFSWTARVTVPVLMVALLFAKLGGDAWLVMTGRPLGGWSEYAIGAGWWLGVLFYVQGVRLYHRRSDLYAAVWTLPVAYLLTLTRMPWGAAWYNACLAVLALGYLLEGYRRLAGLPLSLSVVLPLAHDRDVGEADVRAAQRRGPWGYRGPMVGSPGGERILPPTYLALARQPFFQVAVVLAVVAAFWPAQTAASLVATLYLLAGSFIAATVLLRLRAPAWIGMALLVAAFGEHVAYAELAQDARPLAWALLAAVLLAAGEVAVRRTGESDRPLLATIFALRRGGLEWRSLLGAPLFATGYAVSLIALLLALDLYAQAPVANGARKLDTTPILGFAVLLATLAASSVARRTGFFLYVVTWLALIPIGATAVNIRDWLGRQPYDPDAAKLLAGVSLVYLTVAWLADRRDGRYARPVYLAGYLLLPIAMLISSLDQYVALQVVGFSILLYSSSAWLTHVGRFPSWERLVVRLCGSDASTAAPAVRTLWVYLAVWLLPGWALILTALWEPPLATYALVVSGLALAYPAVGLWIRRVRAEYRWPWYLAGYAMSAIAPLVALTDTTVRPIVLGLSVGLYAASAIVARRAGWLYPVAVLLPVVLWQALGSLGLFDRWYGVGLVVLGLAYGGIGLLLQPLGRAAGAAPSPDAESATPADTRWLIRGRIGGYALPFFVVGCALSALGLARAANQERELTTLAFVLAAGQFAASAVIFRQPLFGWVTAILVAVTYVLGLTLTPLDPAQRGLELLPGGLLALLIAEGLRRDIGRITAWSAPWLVMACITAVAAPWLSYGGEQQAWTLAWWGSTLLFAAMTALLRHPAGLYPTLIWGSIAFLATGYLVQPELPSTRSFATLAALTWAFLGTAYVLERRRPVPVTAPELLKATTLMVMDPDRGGQPVHRRTVERARGSVLPWTVPLHLAGWATLVAACVGSLPSAQDGLMASATLAVLLIGLAILEGAVSYAWLSLGVGTLALVHALRVSGVPLGRQPPYWAAASTVAVLLGLRLRAVKHLRVEIWGQPLAWTSLALAGVSVVAATLVEVSEPGRANLQLLALSIALAGQTSIGHAFWRRDRFMLYAGVGLLEVGLFIELMAFEVGQPQAFALPAGAYLLLIAYLEWRRGAGRPVKRVLEIAALALLLGVSLIQAVGFMGDGLDRYVYATFLLLESAGILALGAMLRWRYTFFAGALALVADVLILLADPLRALNTWYLVALIGLILIGSVIWIERQRQQIPLWLEAWRARLEHWD